MDDFPNYDNLELQKVCGICLIKQENMELISKLASDMLAKCASVEVAPEQFLICDMCENEVKRWYAFKQRVLKALEIGRTTPENITSKLHIELDIKEEAAAENRPEEKKHKCVTCGEAFKTHGQLRTHSVGHKMEEGYKCESCEKNFRTARSLWGHKRRHCQAKTIPCPDCDKSFPFRYDLERHVQARHTSEKNFMCTYCPKRFKVKETLSIHIRKCHLGQQSAGAFCNLCGKLCVSMANLRVHLRSHTGERPFMCEFCSKGFMTNDHLTLHRRIHTGERPFVCERCNKRFISSSVLQKHRRTHTGEKPYKCHLCSKAFSLSSSYKTHLKTH